MDRCWFCHRDWIEWKACDIPPPYCPAKRTAGERILLLSALLIVIYVIIMPFLQ